MAYDVCPALGDVAQGYGCTPYSFEIYWPPCPSQRFHAGIDLWDSADPSGQGQPVYATRSGVIVYLGYQIALENHDLGPNAVCLKTDEGPFIWYGHLSSAAVTPGQRVGVGTVLGGIGTLGISTGPHLHLEARWDANPPSTNDVVTSSIDPTPYLMNSAAPPPPPTEDDMPAETYTQPVIVTAPGTRIDILDNVNPNLVTGRAFAREASGLPGSPVATGTFYIVRRSDGVNLVPKVNLSLTGGAGQEEPTTGLKDVCSLLYVHTSGVMAVSGKVGQAT